MSAREDPPACIDCRYCSANEVTAHMRYTAECLHPSALTPETRDVVSGEIKPAQRNLCAHERSPIETVYDRCGEAGRWFEPRAGA